jgi:hypothetical protein
MFRLRHHLVPAALIAPVIFVCGRLLLVEARTVDHYDRGWPWVFAASFQQGGLGPTQPRQLIFFNGWYLVADLAVLLTAVATIGWFPIRYYYRHGQSLLQFSLRSLLLLVTILAGGMAWLANEHSQWKREQRQLTKLLEKNDPAMHFEVEASAYCGPEWLRHLWPNDDLTIFYRAVGIRCGRANFENSNVDVTSATDYVNSLQAVLPDMPYVTELDLDILPLEIADPSAFSRIEYLHLRPRAGNDDSLKGLCSWMRLRSLLLFPAIKQGEFSDSGLAVLAQCHALDELHLENFRLSDAGIAQLVGLKRLRILGVSETNITDVALDAVGRMTSLESLGLNACDNITDYGVARLASLTRLRGLGLGHTRITGTGFDQLTRLSDLHDLYLSGAQINDTGMAHLANLKQLQNLDLSSTNITDAGLVDLARMSSLESVNLRFCKVTDEGVSHLPGWTKLRHLNLSDTNITDAAMDTLTRIPSLEHIELADCYKLTDRGMRRLLELPNLKKLWCPAKS